jgi:hypothetical protein
VLALVSTTSATLACEKQGSPAANPGPTVIVEQPGEQPEGQAGSETETGDAVTSGEGQAVETEQGTIETVMTGVSCQSDADCVQNTCCHATSCVAVADAPDCSAAVCTMDCRAGTMDCNGGCVCQAGRCAAQLWSPPG